MTTTETVKTRTTADLLAETDALLGSGVMGLLGSTFQQMDWAEDEIGQAQKRHPAATDALFHAFSLLAPTHERMTYELVYRAHCREVLDRVATGADTRPGTAAEICCVCSAASLIAPLNSAGIGAYGRAWAKAFPELPVFTDLQEHYEALNRSTIDDLEADMRRRLTVKDRTLKDTECGGRHHGETVHCRYTSQAAAA